MRDSIARNMKGPQVVALLLLLLLIQVSTCGTRTATAANCSSSGSSSTSSSMFGSIPSLYPQQKKPIPDDEIIVFGNNAAGAMSVRGAQSWLEGLHFEVPRVTTKVPGGLLLTLGPFNCSGLSVTGIASDTMAPKQPQLTLDATGIGGACNGTLSYKYGILRGSGNVSAGAIGAGVRGTVALRQAARTHKGSTRSTDDRHGDLLPASARLDCCEAKLHQLNLSFDGGVALDVINLFHAQIEELLKDNIGDASCEVLTSLVATNLTRAIQASDELLEPLVTAGIDFNISNAAHVDPHLAPRMPDSARMPSRGGGGLDGWTTGIDPGARNNRRGSPGTGQLVDLQANPVMTALDVVVGVLSSGRMRNFNLEKIVDLFTRKDGSLVIPAASLGPVGKGVIFPVSTLANLSLAVHSLEVDGLRTVAMPYGIHAVSPQKANASLTFQHLDVFANTSVFVLPDNRTVNGTLLEEDFQIRLSARNVTISAALMLQAVGAEISKLTFGQLNSACLARSVVRSAIAYLDVDLYVRNVTVTPITIGGGGRLERDIDRAINDVLRIATENFGEAVHYGLLGSSTIYGQQALNRTLNAFLTDSRRLPCGADADDTPTAKYGRIPDVALALAAACWAMALMVAAAGAALRAFCKDAETPAQAAVDGIFDRRPLLRVDGDPAEEGTVADTPSTTKYISFLPTTADGDDMDNDVAGATLCRCVTTRFLASFLLASVGTVFLFVSANTSLGANVMAAVSSKAPTGGEPAFVNAPPLFRFTLESSVRDMWRAEVYSLALLVAVFSGAWPYVKLLTLMAVPFLPAHLLSVRARCGLLGAIDYLGKWSLVDAFVMIIFNVAFKMNIGVDVPELGEAILQIYVAPQKGFYLFVLAAVLSLILGHVAVYANRVAIMGGGTRARPRRYNHFPPSPIGDEFTQPISGRIAEKAIIAATAGLLLSSFFVKIVHFQIEGLAGLLLGHQSSREYAAETLSSTLMSIRWPGQTAAAAVGLIVVGGLLLVFILVMPLLQLSIFFALTRENLSMRNTRKLLFVSEVCGSWSSLDVFAASIAASVLQIESFSKFIVGRKCDLVNRFIRSYLGGLVKEQTCFLVEASLKPAGAALLGTATIVTFGVGLVGVRMLKRRIRNNEQLNFIASPSP